MRNTEYNLEKLASMISSESSFTALMEIMGDMGLEFEGPSRTHNHLTAKAVSSSFKETRVFSLSAVRPTRRVLSPEEPFFLLP